MCTLLELNDDETTMLNLLNWMEQSCGNTVFVLDVDFKHGGVTLYGEPHHTQAFRGKFNEIMARVYEQVPAWREL
jgi:hypothetical protein